MKMGLYFPILSSSNPIKSTKSNQLPSQVVLLLYSYLMYPCQILQRVQPPRD